MNELEQQLLEEESNGVEPTVVIRSQTRIDTGRWWRPTPVWISVVGNELLMLAVSRRRYVARLPIDTAKDTYFCHTTGELVVKPDEDLTYSRLRMTPKQTLSVLNAMGLPQWETVRVDEDEDIAVAEPIYTAEVEAMPPAPEVIVDPESASPSASDAHDLGATGDAVPIAPVYEDEDIAVAEPIYTAEEEDIPIAAEVVADTARPMATGTDAPVYEDSAETVSQPSLPESGVEPTNTGEPLC
jgi:hypothetical protein